MSRKMLHYYAQSGSRVGAREEPWEDVGRSLEYDPTADSPADLRLFVDQYLEALESAHGPMLRRIAENLIDPQDPKLCEFVLKEAKQKQRAMHRGESVRGFNQVRLSHRKVREAFGLAPHQWQGAIRKIRRFTRTWLLVTGAIH
jgi:hypothetical protein